MERSQTLEPSPESAIDTRHTHPASSLDSVAWSVSWGGFSHLGFTFSIYGMADPP